MCACLCDGCTCNGVCVRAYAKRSVWERKDVRACCRRSWQLSTTWILLAERKYAKDEEDGTEVWRSKKSQYGSMPWLQRAVRKYDVARKGSTEYGKWPCMGLLSRLLSRVEITRAYLATRKNTRKRQEKDESVVMNFLRCRLSFSLLRSSLLCLRGSRSNRSLNTTCLSQDSLSLVASEGRLNWIITCSWHVPSLFVFFSERVSPPPPLVFFICLIVLSIF